MKSEVRHIGLLILSLLSVIMTGCRDYDADVVANNAPVRVDIAFTFSSSVAGSQTRQADDLVQNTAERRPNPNSLHIVALKDCELMNSEIFWEEPVYIQGAAPQPASYLYHSGYCNIAKGVNRCLVYGDVADAESGSIPSKLYNGSLVKSPLNNITTNAGLRDVSFSLESIFDGPDIPSDATTLAATLTGVANLEDWVNSDNNILKNLRQNFTNHGFNLPGSAASVKKWLEALASAAQSYVDNPSGLTETDKTILGSVKTSAINAAQSISIDDATSPPYPRSLYLPDGAAVLRWVESATGGSFQPQMQTTTIDNINTVSRFAYPAALYYFVDSGIKTSDSKVDFASEYTTVTTTVDKTAWDSFLEQHFADAETKVTSKSKSIALTAPVQYAVAQLQVKVKAKVKASGSSLPDATSNNISIVNSENGQSFPIKGIIICGQRPVNYLFEQGSNSDAEVKFIYDSQVKDCSLTTALVDACSTLVLQSFTGEDVNIILELENNSGENFKCIDGTVYNGTRFYLVGKVEATGGTGGDEISRGRVFTKDYITTVNMTVSSLAKAYNVLPNLLSSNLEIGVETTPDWISVTPTVIRMEE